MEASDVSVGLPVKIVVEAVSLAVVVVGNTVVLVVVEEVVSEVVRSKIHPDRKAMEIRAINANAFFIMQHLQK